MNKVVIFDWGGIVESHEYDMKDLNDAKIRMIKRIDSSLSDEEILSKWVNKTPDGVNIGTVSDLKEVKRYVEFLQKSLGINISYEDFVNLYEEEFKVVKYYKDVVDYAHSLKSRCKIAILSNLMYFDKKRINDQYDLSKFDYVYLSFEIGMRKPDEKIYKYVLDDLKVKPEDILFIDDDYQNILAAKKCGWNTCLAFGYELDKIKKSVDDFLG